MLSSLLTNIKINWAIIRFNLKAEAAMRESFILLIIGMMINNSAFVVIWILFFSKFGNINGWGVAEVLGVQGFIMMVYGIGMTFGAGARKLPTLIENGSFDNLLVTPGNTYLRIFTSHLRVSAIGDIIEGAILLIVYAGLSGFNLPQIALIILAIIPAVSIFDNILLFSALSGFYFVNASDIGTLIFEIFFAPAMYPGGMIQGFLRFFFSVCIPSLLIGIIPLESVKNWNLELYATPWIFALAWAIITYTALEKSLMRYESGNLVGARG